MPRTNKTDKPKKPPVKLPKSAAPEAKDKLSEQHIRLIMRLFAEGRKPRDVYRVLKEECGVNIAYSLLCHYNPNYQHTDLAQKWREIFIEERKKFLEALNECLGANAMARISRLWDMAEDLRLHGNYPGAAEMMAQIREELAAAKLIDKPSGFAMTSTTIISDGSLDEKKQKLAEMLGIKSDVLPAPSPPPKKKKTE